ncbi:sodium-coupled monocarboxylate transporter 1-like [Mizuhopecten yessoensis]|uniref:Sodium-coupled monocarboxylate transporter 1 n=2 Tax=Mizuhopecten yessoensis TaxID=6573 RepID=A0A210PY94_MIZYE|nr:sodium-coupled monocarboxylate transporter 1-like [Mizuhopecten yessoensis]OWF41457.1 Sodium-coupled monocarboxylate transporter 1 [Mizuhopecten yessoensis]
MSELGFVTVDFVVFALVILSSILIGTYYAVSGGKNKTSLEFHLGNRQMKFLPILISLMVSNQSSIMMLGYPVETYLFGGVIWLPVLGYIFVFMACVRIIIPLFHPMKITSVNEYFELRYGAVAVRRFASICGAMVDTMYSALVLYGPAIAMEGVTGVPFWVSVLSMAVSSILYTSLGGIKAVVWTDVFQFLILYMGIFAVLIKGTMLSGGLRKVWDINKATGRLQPVSFDIDPTRQYTFWSLMIGSTVKALVIPFRQTSVQRVCCTKSAKDAKYIFYLIGPAFVLTMSLAMAMGLVAYAYYYTIRCDPILSKKIVYNQLIPYMVLDIFRDEPGMAGLFMASLFSASLSTVSSNLSGLSAITLEDFIKPHFKKISESKAAIISKVTVVLYGLLATALAFLVAEMKGSLYRVALSIMSVFTAPLLGIFLYSIFFPRATHMGCLVGGIAGMAITLWISMGQSFSTSLRREQALPFAPIDRCFPVVNNTFMNMSITTPENVSTTFDTPTSVPDILNSTLAPFVNTGPQGLDRFYAISFYWFDTLALIVILTVAITVSFIVGRPSTRQVNMKYILSFSEQFFPCLPEKAKIFLTCGVDIEKRRRKCGSHENGDAQHELAVGLIPESPTSPVSPTSESIGFS